MGNIPSASQINPYPLSPNSVYAPAATGNLTNQVASKMQAALCGGSAVYPAPNSATVFPAANNTTLFPATNGATVYPTTNGIANSALNPVFQVLPIQQPAQPFTTAANDIANVVGGQSLVPTVPAAANGTPISFLDKMSDSAMVVDEQYIVWKRNADYDNYLKARKYFVWKQYCNGKVDDWSNYGKWKKIWKEADTEAYRNDYRRWKELFTAVDLALWKEWTAWKAIKKELQNQYVGNKKISKRELDKMYKEYKRWHRNCSMKSYKHYYKFTKWHEHAGAEWKNLNKYYQWRKNWSYNDDCKFWEQKWKAWRRNHNDCDYRNWVNWRQWLQMKGEQTKEANSNSESDSSEQTKTKVKDNARYRNYDGYYDHDGNWYFYDHHDGRSSHSY